MKNLGLVILIEDFISEWLDWSKEAGLTSLGLHKIAIPGTDSVNELLKQLNNETRTMINRFQDNGIKIEYELHALEWLLPRKLFSDKPELFRVKDGKRVSDLNCCSSNKDALEIISENSYKLAKLLKQESSDYYFWTDDAMDGFCECERCCSFSASDQNMLIVNAMQKGVKAYDSNAKMSYLAYASALQVPVIKPDEGVFLEFAPMHRNQDKPITAADEDRSINYISLLKKLLEIFPAENSQILEYWLDVAMYSGYKYPPVKVPFKSDRIIEEAKFYNSLGIGTIKSFASYISHEYKKLHGEPPFTDFGSVFNSLY